MVLPPPKFRDPFSISEHAPLHFATQMYCAIDTKNSYSIPGDSLTSSDFLSITFHCRILQFATKPAIPNYVLTINCYALFKTKKFWCLYASLDAGVGGCGWNLKIERVFPFFAWHYLTSSQRNRGEAFVMHPTRIPSDTEDVRSRKEAAYFYL